MGFPFMPVIGLVGRIISKVLPGKTATDVSKIATDIVNTDKGLRDAFQQFTLAWFRPDLLPRWALACKNLWRPLLATTGFFYALVWHATHGGDLPLKIWGLVIAVVIGFGGSRGLEKLRKHIV